MPIALEIIKGAKIKEVVTTTEENGISLIFGGLSSVFSWAPVPREAGKVFEVIWTRCQDEKTNGARALNGFVQRKGLFRERRGYLVSGKRREGRRS